jgi:hypothetical protein
MTYAQGGLIQAADYNGLVGGNPTDVAGTLNRVWGVGQNDRGYGQTAVSQVSAGATVTGSQWASLINNLNSAYRHNTNSSGTGLAAPTTGNTILFISTLSGYITDIYNNRLSTTGSGTTTTFSSSYSQSAAGGVSSTGSATRTVTFSSVDQCRYFWNAGGTITFDVTSVTNNDGTSRSGSIVTLANTNFNAKTVRARSAAARTGTGGASVTDVTASGFYNLTTSYTTFVSIAGQTYPYTGDSLLYQLLTNGTAGSYSGNGNVITLFFQTTSGTTGTGPSPTSDPMNVTVNYTITVTYPSTTYLTNSWGTATIA